MSIIITTLKLSLVQTLPYDLPQPSWFFQLPALPLTKKVAPIAHWPGKSKAVTDRQHCFSARTGCRFICLGLAQSYHRELLARGSFKNALPEPNLASIALSERDSQGQSRQITLRAFWSVLGIKIWQVEDTARLEQWVLEINYNRCFNLTWLPWIFELSFQAKRSNGPCNSWHKCVRSSRSPTNTECIPGASRQVGQWTETKGNSRFEPNPLQSSASYFCPKACQKKIVMIICCHGKRIDPKRLWCKSAVMWEAAQLPQNTLFHVQPWPSFVVVQFCYLQRLRNFRSKSHLSCCRQKSKWDGSNQSCGIWLSSTQSSFSAASSSPPSASISAPSIKFSSLLAGISSTVSGTAAAVDSDAAAGSDSAPSGSGPSDAAPCCSMRASAAPEGTKSQRAKWKLRWKWKMAWGCLLLFRKTFNQWGWHRNFPAPSSPLQPQIGFETN